MLQAFWLAPEARIPFILELESLIHDSTDLQLKQRFEDF